MVSLLALDGGDSPEAAVLARKTATPSVKAAIVGETDVEVVVAQGRTVGEAVDRLDWQDGEALPIGSSRLAQHRSIFLGTTANRILRALPVPMIVVPSHYESNPEPDGSIHSTSNDTSGKTTP